jgi:alanine dehydrogenase
MRAISIAYLNRLDVERLAQSEDDILGAVEASLRAQGNRETVIEPRVHLVPESSAKGHFNILRGIVGPLGVAGVKIVGDFYENYLHDLPSEVAVLNLFDPQTGIPLAFIDATAITEMRTGAVTAIGAKHLARKNGRILGHVGARGTAYWNIRLLDRLFASRRSACTRAAPKVVTASPRRYLAISEKGCDRSSRGRSVCATPTSWWKRRACRRPNRC